MTRTAVISGAGQDGSTLADFLLEKDYRIVLFSQRSSSGSNQTNIKHLIGHPRFTFLDGDICDAGFLTRILRKYQPEEYYGTAANSHVWQSFQEPTQTLLTNSVAVITQLELIRQLSPHTKFLNCSSSETFGGLNCPLTGFNENSPFNPRSPYAISKVGAFFSTKLYREAYNLHASSSICFNHSDVRRGMDFATRKITRGVAAVKLGLQRTVRMGDLTPYRDEGSATDYVRAMWMMLQQDQPDDYVIATGVSVSIRQMLEYVCELAGLSFDEVYEMDERFMRPAEVQYLLGDASKARQVLGWKPEITWQDLLKKMYLNDLSELSKIK